MLPTPRTLPIPNDTTKRICFTVAGLIVFRIGSFLPLPGIDPDSFGKLLTASSRLGGGEAVARVSIFGLGVMPYVSSCVFVHLVAAFYKPLRALRSDGTSGWLRFNQCIRYGALILAILQSYGIAVGLEAVSNLVPQPGLPFRLTTVVTLVAGTMLLVWLGEQIFARGVTDGVWLLFAASYVAELPTSFAGLIEITRSGMVPVRIIPICAGLFIALVAFIVLVERAERRFPTSETGNEGAERTAQASTLSLSFRLDNTGVLAPMIASSLLLFPATVAASLSGQDKGWVARLMDAFRQDGLLFVPVYALLIVFFVFFFTAMVVNPKVGRGPDRAGEAAERDLAITHVTLVGALYLAILCVVPELMISFAALPLYIGGTSLLVSVLVSMSALARARGQ
jgi:preprotein translocase subunit SecY